MTDRRSVLATLAAGIAGLFAARRASAASEHFAVTRPDAEWRRRLAPQAYQVLRHESTERPYSSPLNAEHRAGVFACGGCAQPLFTSKTKFESGTGWPSFWAPLPNAVATRTDYQLVFPRTEVHCDQCGGHLGHIFNDGPKPTGKRYCLNGAALTFRAA